MPTCASCPAANVSRSAVGDDLVVVCGVLRNERENELQHGLQDGGKVTLHHTRTDAAVFSTRDNAGTVLRFCCDRYTECTIWQAEKDRIEGEHHSIAAMSRAARFEGE